MGRKQQRKRNLEIQKSEVNNSKNQRLTTYVFFCILDLPPPTQDASGGKWRFRDPEPKYVIRHTGGDWGGVEAFFSKIAKRSVIAKSLLSTSFFLWWKKYWLWLDFLGLVQKNIDSYDFNISRKLQVLQNPCGSYLLNFHCHRKNGLIFPLHQVYVQKTYYV